MFTDKAKSVSRYDDSSRTGDGQFWTTDVTAEMKIKHAEEDRFAPITLVEAFQKAVEKRGDKIALRVERSKLPPLENKKPPPALDGKDW